MNAHNEQHDPASAVVKQNLTTQPAAAQEAVGWQFWHEMPGGGGEWRNGSPDHVVKNHRKNTEAAGIPTRDVYAAPVTAAPAVDVETLRALSDRWANDRSYTGSPVDDIRALIEQPTKSTPAAPGIDNTTPVDRGALQMAINVLRRAGKDEVADALIDASPKGGSAARVSPWRPIFELPISDDLFWFACGDTVDGPRAPQAGGYDADEWDWFAPAEAPAFTPEMEADCEQHRAELNKAQAGDAEVQP